ncbi:CHAT domain-containing protein [Mycena vulgaris]|nr:CHAT domain-containing protein [Mycena vulgaris]
MSELKTVIQLHSIRVTSLIIPHDELPGDMKMFAQLIIEGNIFLQTLPVASEQDKMSWKLGFGCNIPPHAPTFSVTILRQRETEGTRLLGYIEIGRGEVLGSVESNRRTLQLEFNKVNLDGPSLKFSAGFTVSELPYQEVLISMAENTIASVKGREIGSELQKMYKDSRETEFSMDALQLRVMHERILLCYQSNDKRARLLNILGDVLLQSYKGSGTVDDLNQAVCAYNDAVRDDPGSVINLTDLGRSLLHRFERFGSLLDIHRSIEMLEDAVRLTPDGHPESLDVYANALDRRFERTGELADLEESITFHRQTLELRPGSHPNRSNSLINLAYALKTRFEQTGQLADLEESIAFHRQALELRPGSHPDRSGSLNDLASALWTRFEQTGQLADLEESIAFHQQALELRPGSHPHRSRSLNNLANALKARFEQTGQLADLEESIAFHRQALELFPESHPYRSSSLNNLANALETRFEQTGQLADLEESIAFHRQALELTPGSHPHRSGSLSNLASALSTRFEQTGQLADLEESIAFHQQALELTPESNPNRSSSLNNLATALWTRFEQTGQLADLEESIAFHRQALELSPESHPKRSGSLNNLASALLIRFEQTSQLTDLEESIALHRQALELRPGSYPHRSTSLNNLASALWTRFKETGQLADLEESIAFHQQALELAPGSNPNRSRSLNNLAIALSTRFQQTGQLADLEESIAFHREALELFPGSHLDRSHSLNNLASELQTRFGQTSQLADLEESITFHRQALELRPGSHPDRSVSLTNLANALSTRLEQTGQLADLDESMICFRDASAHETSSVIARFHHSRRWARKAASFHHSSALEAYQYSINLLPRLASLDLQIRQRQEALSRARGLACDACSYAIQEGQFDKAVEFLSAGRTVFWTQALQLRTPLDELQSVAPHLALKLRTISNALEATSAHDGSQALQDSSKHIRDLEQEATRRRLLNKDWNDTLEAVRKLKDFDDFLLPKSISNLRKASSNGPVVFLNAAESGCDALVVTQEKVKHIPLPDLSIKTTQDLGDTLRMALSSNGARSDTLQALLQSIRTNPRLKAVRMPTAGHTPNDLFGAVLRMLWFTVARPVIDALDLKIKPDDKGILPRIWWCPTGPFAFLPIHAAGVYEGNNPESLSDYAISSYTPTLDTLLASPPPKVHEPKMLAVIQPEMPGDRRLDLPFTFKELDMIEQHVPTTWLTKLGTKEEPTSVGRVLSLLPDASFVHFACHGSQDLVDPLESALLLGDGDLKVSKIMQTPIQNASLAFLSACETAMGDENVPDEAMHLAATMLFAGFRGVVGTMWTMHDEDGPEVVDVFYNHIFKPSRESHPDSTKAAEALHLAVKKLRTEKKASFQRWVPFIHLGL